MSIPLVQNNEKDSINTSIIAIKRNIERINMLLGLSNSEEIDTSEFVKKSDIVDEVTVGNMQSVTSNAVAVAVDTINESLIGVLKTENQEWSNNHSYTLKREGKYLLFCVNPNINCSGVYFVLGRHRTISQLIGYTETIKSPPNATYNVSVSGDTLKITGDYCTTHLIFISDI